MFEGEGDRMKEGGGGVQKQYIWAIVPSVAQFSISIKLLCTLP
jgi:hypothetical protein